MPFYSVRNPDTPEKLQKNEFDAAHHSLGRQQSRNQRSAGSPWCSAHPGSCAWPSAAGSLASCPGSEHPCSAATAVNGCTSQVIWRMSKKLIHFHYQSIPEVCRAQSLLGDCASGGCHLSWQWRMTSKIARALTAASRSDKWPRSTIRSNSSPPAQGKLNFEQRHDISLGTHCRR